MRALTVSEIQEVNGGMALDTGLNLIGAIGTIAVYIAPTAAAFAAGVLLGSYGVRAWYELTY